MCSWTCTCSGMCPWLTFGAVQREPGMWSHSNAFFFLSAVSAQYSSERFLIWTSLFLSFSQGPKWASVFSKKGFTTNCFLSPLIGFPAVERIKQWGEIIVQNYWKWIMITTSKLRIMIIIFAFSWMYMKLLLCTRVYICVLTLSNLSVCDISVSMKCSYLVAPVHNNWIQYSWMIFQ